MEKLLINKFYDLCFEIYPKRLKKNFDIANQSIFFKFLNKNRLDSFFALKYVKSIQDNTILTMLESLIENYKTYENNLTFNLKLVKQLLGKNEFIIIKTLSSYPHTTSDLDIIVKTPDVVSYATTALKKRNDIFLPIDISCKISWTDSTEISSDFIWKNTKKSSLNNIDFLVPNDTFDALIRIAHIPFELAEIRLGELLHIYSCLDTVNLSILEQEAKKNGWPKTWKNILTVLLKLKNDLFTSNRALMFPYNLKYTQLLSAVIEKKAWKKMLGARYIIRDRLFK